MDGMPIGNYFRKDFDIIIETFTELEMNKITPMPMITVYKKPIDYPGKYVARLFGISEGKPSIHRQIIIKDTLEEIQSCIPSVMQRIPRSLTDDPKILEIYL